ncbi:alpha/beta hydrolase [Amycolatopsis endophytica]|uniref:Pimeloyl-ACP methyl ester carboxylesterase n=1 Tax=Amycolatopsis endophytica TaxID=860233 RepID=A0A853BAX5_9PSEU|nr:alpha/beta hydrolase [Amycolatopsis endophytica]NYI91837.1 pimeloyl-ACP methyl ester carboxylesterase [Amycolatopsis endophytica]
MKFGHRLRPVAATVALGAAAVLALGVVPSSATETTEVQGRDSAKPTVVLVHGAFADAAGWDGVIGELQRDGYPVLAVANPLRGLAADSAYLRSVLDTVPGPVVLVGHSYGGAVITNAATGSANVTALVYTAAFAPDAGENLNQFSDPARYPGSELTPDALVIRPYPGGIDATIDPARFRDIFAADLPRPEVVKMAARQRPVSVAALGEPSGAPAWKTIPSWYLVSTQDKAISPVAQRFFAQRAGAHTVEIRASHVGYISHPDITSRLIESAARSAR